MGYKKDLHNLVDVLSEYECKYLLRMAGDISEGERFWEGDFGNLYNEYVKLRYFKLPRNRSTAPLSSEEGRFVPIPITKSYGDADRIDLPKPRPFEAELVKTLLHRRSRRSYTGVPISLSELSCLLYYACGAVGVVSAYGYSRLPLRMFPSHGGLQSSEIYLSINAVSDVPPGIYHYHALDHVLEVIDKDTHKGQLPRLAFDEQFFNSAAVVLLLTGYYERLRWKYGERSYRFMCIDTGFVGQNIYLVSEALGLGACAVSGFAQDGIEELFGIDGKNEIALLLMTLGAPAVELVQAEQSVGAQDKL
jgi:SagB-type dehydrogenase family enzyme